MYNRYDINPFIFSTKHYVLAEYGNFYLPPLQYIGPEKSTYKFHELEITAYALIGKLQNAYELKSVTTGEPLDETADIPLIQSTSELKSLTVEASAKIPHFVAARIIFNSLAEINNNTVLKIFDSTNNEHHGIKLTDDLTKGQFVFDGVNDYIQVLDDIFESEQDFTIQLKCELDEPNISQILIGSGLEPPEPSLLLYSNTNLGSADQQIRVFAQSSEKLVGSDITESGETLITLTRSGGTWKLYENGLIVATEEDDFDLIGNDLVIGGHLYLDDLYKGTIKNVQISDVARSAEWIYLDHLSQDNDLIMFSDIQEEFYIISDYEVLYSIGKKRQRNFKSIYSLRYSISESFQALYSLFETTVSDDFETIYSFIINEDTKIEYTLSRRAIREVNINYSLFKDVFNDIEIKYNLIPEKFVKRDTKAIYSLRSDQFIWSNPTFVLQIEGNR